MSLPSTLSRRERQIMDALYALGRATAQKGHVRHEEERPRYVYLPIVTARRAQRAALGD